MNFTSEWLAQHEAKRGKGTAAPADATPDGEEASLHDFAIRTLKNRNLPFVHSRMDRAATCTPGSPDLIFVIGGRVVMVEFKTRTGKLSSEQTIWHHLAKREGVEVHVIRSTGEFLTLLRQGPIQNGGEGQDSRNAVEAV